MNQLMFKISGLVGKTNIYHFFKEWEMPS